MIKISVVSEDRLFASMLCSEIESLGKDYTALLNEADGAALVILDLDTDNDQVLPDVDVIGFSRKEISRDGCHTVLHRPFLMETFKDIVLDLVSEEKIIREPELSMDDIDKNVYIGGRKIHLSSNEYAIMKKLSENLSQPVSREELGSVLSSSEGNMCDAYVCRLRTKLEKNRSERFIFTVRGKGYMLKI